MTDLGWVPVLRSAVAIALVFVVCVVVHEFGHYAVAKRCGVAVPTFAIGFGPRLVRWFRGGTEFSVRLFPLGGMVQLAGEIPHDALFRRGERIAVRIDPDGWIDAMADPADLGEDLRAEGWLVGVLQDLDLTERWVMTIAGPDGVRTYPVRTGARLHANRRTVIPLVERSRQVIGKPLWQRALIILAGPLMNFALAGVLFSAFYWHTGIPVNEPVLGAVAPGSPAAHAGLHQGDQVLSVDGRPVDTWMSLVERVRADRTGKPLLLRIKRDGVVLNVTVRPRLTKQGPLLGVSYPMSYNVVRAVSTGFSTVYFGSINALGMYFQVFAHHQFNNLAGPVGIADVISQEAQSGIWQVVMITGWLSLNLGLFNLLPFPALDGGRLLFMVAELVRGRSFDPRKEGLVHFLGFALLMLFAAVITYRDVTRLF
ncbi:zinc metalloprotease [Alicyclobacillus cellulosilyticus]|uniref:Zinc metalloprotease n=1 Tax=Alicyclobacillus cellulosilyticus TaxID=1003997 RepID=A0A917JZF8_9BACL|nr:M50 family metallopeptidase [Alicyclobacillus cellulosilyticus]GGI94558.1 zinc metalloprotease [Alicyclobacillus cellulosilyticus]